jgi:hypothetical protein
MRISVASDLLRITRRLGANLLRFTPRLVEYFALFGLGLARRRSDAFRILHALGNSLLAGVEHVQHRLVQEHAQQDDQQQEVDDLRNQERPVNT